MRHAESTTILPLPLFRRPVRARCAAWQLLFFFVSLLAFESLSFPKGGKLPLLGEVRAMFAAMAQLRSMLSLNADYVGASVNGIPGLHFDTDNNSHGGDRVQ